MGAHEAVMNGKKGVYFAVWAPNATTVSVIGEFNGWREEANPMTRLEPSGIYEGFVQTKQIQDMLHGVSPATIAISFGNGAVKDSISPKL